VNATAGANGAAHASVFGRELEEEAPNVTEIAAAVPVAERSPRERIETFRVAEKVLERRDAEEREARRAEAEAERERKKGEALLHAHFAAKEAARALIPDLIDGSRLLDTEYPPVEYAIDPIAPRGEIAEWTGAHGIFKSTIALAACLSVASGRRFGGLPVFRGRAVFITAEDGERTVAHRVRAWLEGVPVGEERRAATAAIRERFSFLAREHVRGLALTVVEYGEPGTQANALARLADLVKGASLVILETAARLADGNENENRVQATFAQALEEVATASGAAVGIVRHVSKQAARDGSTDSYSGRGGGALSDAARSVIVFTRERPDGKQGGESNPLAPVTMTHAKATLSRPADRILWQPVETSSGGVYLRPLSDDETLRANGRKLLAALPPEGITATDLHKRPPAGLGRSAAKAALEHLLEIGQLAETERPHGHNRKPVAVYTTKPEAAP